MTATKGLGTYGNGVGTVTPLDHKMAHLGLVAKTAANTIRPGLFWDGDATIVSGKANMSYDVRAFSAVTSRSSTAGAVLLTNDAVYNVATTAAPGSNSRYDVVYVWQREYSIDGTDSNPVIGVVQGTAAASPSVPSLASFPGAIELARILVPSGVTATNSGTTITQTAPFTATSGGTIPFRSTTERDAGSYVEGQDGWLIDSNRRQVYSGSEWQPLAGLVLIGTTSFSATTAVNVDSVFSSTYDSYKVEIVSSGTASTVALQLRGSASTISTSTYDLSSILGRNATVTHSTTASASSWSVQGTSNTLIKLSLDLSSPALAAPTTGILLNGVHSNPAVQNTANALFFQFLSHQTSTAYDGIRVTFSANQTGSVRVYGYSQ